MYAQVCSFLSVSLFNYSYWPQDTSGLRRNSLHSWITHLHPIIYQDPSAKLAGSSIVTSRPSTLSQVEVDVDVLRVRLCRARLTILSPLTCGSFWWLPGRAWVHSSYSTTTDLERRWFSSSLLSLCSNIFCLICNGSLRRIGLRLQRELVLIGWEGCIRVDARMKEGL